jgi:hypothetical protein
MSAGIKFHRVSHFLDNSSNAHNLPNVGGDTVQEALKQIGFKVPFNPTFELNRDFDIPYLCGYDSKKDVVYFDRDFTPTFNGNEIFPTKTLMTHEEVEKELETVGILWDYEQRHHIATYCERRCVEHLGVDWAAYTRWTTESWHASYAKWNGSASGLKVPPTLDMSPYVDEDDKLVKAMRKAGAKDSGEEA